jgi:hypothetical protein
MGRLAAFALALSLLAAACSPGRHAETSRPPAPPAAAKPAEAPVPVPPLELTPSKVEEIAELCARIELDPTKTASLLEQHGLTFEALDSAMTRILADSAMSALLAKAKGDAKAAARAEAASTRRAPGT